MAHSNFKIPLLNGNNFSTWAPQMEAILHKCRLLRIVRGEEQMPVLFPIRENATPAEIRQNEESIKMIRDFEDKDQDARAEIIVALEPDVVRMVKNFRTSSEIWSYLKETYDRKSTRKKAELFRKLLKLRMGENQNITEYLTQFDIIVSELRELIDDIDEDFLTVMLLDSLPSKYEAIKAAFDTATEFPTLNILRSRLLEIGNKTEQSVSNCEDSALKVNRFRKGGSRKSNNYVDNQGMNNFFPYTCFKCGKKGHMAKHCRNKNYKANEACELSDNESIQCGYAVSTRIIHEHSQSFTDSIRWILDSGASSHMTYLKSQFIEIDETFKGNVRLADDNDLEIKGIGTVQLKVKIDNQIKIVNLPKTLFIPELRSNLFSIAKATDNGCKVEIVSDKAIVFKNDEVLIYSEKKNGLYCIESFLNIKNVISKKSDQEFLLWHRRYGHLNASDLRKLVIENMVNGLPNFNKQNINCISCIRGKQIRKSFPKKSEKSSNEILELIHTDLCGPMRVESMGKKFYFATFIDDFSRKVYVYFLRNKSEYLNIFKEFKAEVELKTGKRIKNIRSDNASELKSQQFDNFLKKYGIKHQFSVQYTPEQNGVAERMNRTLVEMARTIMIEAKLPEFLWAELIMTASYIRNLCPTKLNNNKTPEELFTGKKPTVKHLRQIGCKAFVLDKKSGKSKWQARSSEFILIGYSSESKAYRLWKRGTHSVVKSRDIKFIEEDFEVDLNEVQDKNVGFYEFSWYKNDQEERNGSSNSNLNTIDAENSNSIQSRENLNENGLNRNQFDEDSTSEEEQISDNSSKNSDDQPAPTTSIKERLRSWTLFKNREEANAIAHEENETDPKSFKEIFMSKNVDEWICAVEQEYNSLIKNQTWDLVDLPNDRKTIGCKWVFKTKLTPDGKVDKRKARLVAKGYNQKYGIDYTDTFAPVVRQTSLRLVYALSVENDLKLKQLDVSTAFLNGDLDEEIFMDQPEGFIIKGTEKKVCLLKKSIYGLKQAGRQWFKKIDEVLKKFNLTNSKYDQCIYYLKNNTSILIVTLYVDDIIIACNNDELTNMLTKLLSNNFEIRDLKEPKHCLGLEICKENDSLSICQPGYIESIIDKYGLSNAKSVKIPMQPKTNLEKEPKIVGEREKVDQTKYQEIIGSLLHLSVFSRPDISCSVNKLSQFCQDPRKQHMNAALYIIRYLKETKDWKLVYKKTSLPLIGYADANWAEDIYDRKSQSGFCFILAGAVISWESRKQNVVATSSAESEYIALAESTKEAMYLRYLLEELGFPPDGPTVIMSDSQSAQHMANFGGHHSRTKHIHYRYHFIRDAVANKIINIKYVPTENMTADVLTKSLPRIKHEFCIQNMGITFKNNNR